MATARKKGIGTHGSDYSMGKLVKVMNSGEKIRPLSITYSTVVICLSLKIAGDLIKAIVAYLTFKVCKKLLDCLSV